MSEEQLSALLAELNEDAGLREKLQSAGDLDAFVAMAKEAGFDVSKADWLKYQANQTLELRDEELEKAAGGVGTLVNPDVIWSVAVGGPGVERGRGGDCWNSWQKQL